MAGPGFGTGHLASGAGTPDDWAYIAGNNHPACDSAPGHPYVDGNGRNGCIKAGRRTQSSPAPGRSVASQGTNQTRGVQLVK